MKDNQFPTNPICCAQYIWENIEIEDVLIDKFENKWEVTSYDVFQRRRIRIHLTCIDCGGYMDCCEGNKRDLTRCDLASGYYYFINYDRIDILPIKFWDVKVSVINYNTIWNLLDTMNPPVKEEKEDMNALFNLAKEAEKEHEEWQKELSNYENWEEKLFEKSDYDGDKVRKKVEKCLPKEDKKMTENEKNYFPKNKGKTGVDTQLKSAFYSQEELDEVIKKIGDFLETQTNTAKNKCKDSVKKIYGLSDEEFDEKCARVVDTLYNGVDKATDFSKKTFYEFRNWWRENHKDDEIKVKESEPETKTVRVDSKPVTTITNTDEVSTHKVSSTDTDTIDPKHAFKLGDVVYTKDNSVGYISRLGYADKYCYYYWTPLVVSFNDRNKSNPLKINEELGLTYPYENHYKRIGNYFLSDLNCMKEIARIDSIYKLSEDNLKKFPYLDKYVNNNDEKDSNTSTPNDATPSSNRKTISVDSLPNYLGRLNLTDSTYSFEVNTKLTTETACKLNDVIEALNDVIWYLQEEERKRHLEER